MSKFDYTLPSGAKFVVDAPATATRNQADRVFYEQVAAGSLVGYQPGQTLTSSATRLTKFELSRLDRGTAGVESNVVLAISQGLSTTGAIEATTTQTLLAAIETLPIPVAMPNLGTVPLTDPVDESDVVLIRGDDLPPEPVGPLDSYQVQKLLAQIAKLVDQQSDQISLEKGIGRYGFTCYALETVGYVKPGTSLKYFANGPDNFVEVMSSPSVWTGKDGIYSLTDLLSRPEIQNKIQVQLMQLGYQQLISAGAIVETPQSSVTVSTGQVYTNVGLTSISNLTPGATAGSGSLDLKTIASGAASLLAGTSTLSKLNLNNLTVGITNRLTGDIGALVANASKYGSQATALWAKAGNISLNNLGSSITSLATGGLTKLGNLAGGGLNNLTGTLGTNFNNIAKNLTNLVPPNLGNLGGGLNVLGKAGSFATNFANPLNNLNSLGGNLSGQLSGQLTALQGQAGAVVGQLQGQLTALQGQAGALAGQAQAAIGNLGGLFSGGGDLVSGTQVAAGFNNTVNRKTVDAAFNRILGSSKIPAPVYEYPSLPSVSARLDILQAQNVLKDLQNSEARTFGQGVTI